MTISLYLLSAGISMSYKTACSLNFISPWVLSITYCKSMLKDTKTLSDKQKKKTLSWLQDNVFRIVFQWPHALFRRRCRHWHNRKAIIINYRKDPWQKQPPPRYQPSTLQVDFADGSILQDRTFHDNASYHGWFNIQARTLHAKGPYRGQFDVNKANLPR